MGQRLVRPHPVFRPLSGSALNMGNNEQMYARGGLIREGRPRRKIHDNGGILTIDQSSAWFWTTDRTLAEAVRKVLDRIDPLPCAGHDPVEITRFMDASPRYLCRWCGERLDP